MGVAAYQRGSALISRQIRREFGMDCPEDRPRPAATPRPPEWGSETRRRALISAKGFIVYTASRGRLATVEEIVEYLSGGGAVSAVCGKSTARSIALELTNG